MLLLAARFNVWRMNSHFVRVAARFRPLNDAEAHRGDSCAACISHDSGSDGEALVQLTVPVQQRAATDGSADADRLKTFGMQRAFGMEASQQDIFDSSDAIELLDSVLGGYSATIFAYGQTGSGKTYTMFGAQTHGSAQKGGLRCGGEDQRGVETGQTDPGPARTGDRDCQQQDGIVPRSVRYLYSRMAERATHADRITYRVRMSYCEIYNEQARGGAGRWQRRGIVVAPRAAPVVEPDPHPAQLRLISADLG